MGKTALGYAIGVNNEWVLYTQDGIERAYSFSRNSVRAEYLASLFQEEIDKIGMNELSIVPVPGAGVLIDAPTALLKKHSVYNHQKAGPDKDTFIIRTILASNRLWLPMSVSDEYSRLPDKEQLYEGWFAGGQAELLLKSASGGHIASMPQCHIETCAAPEYIAEEKMQDGAKTFAKVTVSAADLKDIGIYDYINHFQGALTRKTMETTTGSVEKGWAV